MNVFATGNITLSSFKVDKEIYAWKPIRQFWLGFHIIILQVLYLFFIAILAPLELGFFCFNGRVVVCSNLETGVLVRT